MTYAHEDMVEIPSDTDSSSDVRQQNMEEIKAMLGKRIALIVTVASIPVWWSTLGQLADYWPQFLAFVALTLIGLTVLWLYDRHPILARGILVLGPNLAAWLALARMDDPFAPFLSVIVVGICIAISTPLGIGAVLLQSVLILVLTPDRSGYIALTYVWLTATIGGFSSRGLYVALDWAWTAHTRSVGLLSELRQQRGQLNQTLEALTEATRRLERTNRELAVAREQADMARATREQFVANVSHELRTPLNLIVGFAEMMYLVPDTYDGVVWTPDLVSDIARMHRASRHLQDLVDDILDLSRIDAARLPMFRELTSIRTVIEDASETIMPILEQRKLGFELICPHDIPDLFVDRTRIRQVMLNLLNNACRFTVQGGIVVRVEKGAESIRIAVEDTGVGIPADQLDSIFEEFHQVELGSRGRGGTGLGLAISKQFTELHGGRMWAESELGAGSIFYLSLPLPGAVSSQKLYRVPNQVHPDDTRQPIIVVDPDPTIADMLSRYLGSHPILSARETAQADALVESEHPLAVIVNTFPEAPPEEWLGASGQASARYDVPVIRCSMPSASWLRQQTGFDEYLTKPISREVVREITQRFAGNREKILVADDDPGFVSLIVRMIQSFGQNTQVLTAYSGDEALRLILENQPKLAILDLYMPGMSGLEVAEALRKEALQSTVHVVAVSATNYPEDVLLQNGGYLTITQPLGYSAGTMTEFLNLAVQIFRPNYVKS